MEIQKETFTALMEYYKKLPIDVKRSEIVDELEELISSYSRMCTKFGEMPNMMLSREMLNTNRENLTEEEFLNAIFAYINTLEDISAQFINKVCDKLEE